MGTEYGIDAASSTAYLPHDIFADVRHYRRVSSKIDVLTQRIAAKLAELNLTEREASIDATGKPDAIRYIRSRNAMPSAERLQQLAQTLRTTPEWLLGGDGPDTVSSPGDDLPGQPSLPDFRRFPKNLPIYGTALGADLDVISSDGATHAVEQTDLFLSEPRDYMARPTALAARDEYYVVEVAGHSMEPRFDSGRRVLVSSKKRARVNDDIIVQLRAPIDNTEEVAAVLIKQLVKEKAGAIVMRQFNPALEFEVPRDRIKHVHTIVPWDDVLSI